MQNLAYKTVRGGAWGKCASRIVIAHGLLGNSSNWSTAARRLAEHELIRPKLHEVNMLDMRNHGESPHAPNHTSAAMASDLELFVMQRGQQHQDGEERSDDNGVVLVGHSMGGLALMATMLRRTNEAALLLPSAEELQARCEQGEYYGWSDEQSYAKEMRSANQAMGFPPQQPLLDVLYCCGGNSVASSREQQKTRKIPRVKAAVIVDIAPTTRLGTGREASDSVAATLDAMTAVDLSHVHSFSDGGAALERAGVRDKDMRDFILTNLRLNSKTGEAKWRCNLPVLRADYRKMESGLWQWYVNADERRAQHAPNGHTSMVGPERCTLPTLFVFGEKSPYNNTADRKMIDLFFANATQVEVAGSGHFVHYEKLPEFITAVAPFIAKHL